MLAVQRQPTPLHSHNSPIIRSRLLVQPTKTPGLLSLSKPLLQQQQRRQPREPRGSSPKSKQPSNTPTKTPSAALVKPPTSTPSPRGRNNNSGKPKSSTPRSSSRSSVRARRSDRQPSPPAVLLFPCSSDEESTTIKDRVFTPSATFFDPFIDNVQADQKASQSSSPTRKAAAPTLTSRPSGKLAKRRQPSAAGTATSSTPIVPPATPPQSSKTAPVPVPKANRRSSPAPLSHSQPDPAPLGAIPICDESEVSEAISSPVTPVRPKSNGYGSTHGRNHSHSYGDFSEFDNRGPKTAPILSSFAARGSDFFQSPTPPSRVQKTRNRQRVPSVDSAFSRNVLEDLPIRSTTTIPSTSDDEFQRMKAAFFASSSFQNSPSPDDLPPPDF